MFVLDIKSYCKAVKDADDNIIRYTIPAAMSKFARDECHEVMFMGGLNPTITFARVEGRDHFIAKYPKAK